MSFFVRIALVLAFAAGAGSVLADGEQQRVDDLEKRIREMEAKIAEQDRKSADASLKAREFNAKADESRRRASDRSRVFDDARRRADRERRRVNGSDRTMNDAKRRIGDLEQKVSDRKAAMKGIEDDRRRLVNDEQVNKLKRATQAQRDIQERIDMLRKILAADEPEIQKLVQPNSQENELVTTDTSAMKMVDAYEIAKQIEAAITESYKDVKAT
jgi:chromosome segregation ATPase